MEITARFTSNSPITRVRQNNLFITILKPPVSDNMIIINKIKDICESLDDLPEVGQITVEMAEFFKKLLAQRKNIIIHKIKNIYYIIIYNKAHKQVYNSYVIRYIFLLGLLHLFYICFYFFSYLITLTDLRFEVMDRNSDLQEMYS